MDASIMEERLLRIDAEIHRLLSELRYGHSKSHKGIEGDRAYTNKILEFAGCWDDLSEGEFNIFT